MTRGAPVPRPPSSGPRTSHEQFYYLISSNNVFIARRGRGTYFITGVMTLI